MHLYIPDTTKEPKPTDKPEPTKGPNATEEPKPTDKPEPTKGPDVTEEPKPTKGPDATEEPRPTKGPDVTETSKPTGNPSTEAGKTSGRKNETRTVKEAAQSAPKTADGYHTGSLLVAACLGGGLFGMFLRRKNREKKAKTEN